MAPEMEQVMMTEFKGANTEKGIGDEELKKFRSQDTLTFFRTWQGQGQR